VSLEKKSTIVSVKLEHCNYDICIDSNVIGSLGSIVSAQQTVSHAVIITDTNVQPHAERVNAALVSNNIETHLLVVPAGEASKSVEQLNDLWIKLRSGGADRKSIVVAVGGGVVGDLAGFVAATYGRGLAFFQVPTTLLAQVDSSVGGKVGINLPSDKNMVGAFWQPHGVLIDTDVLATLPLREFRSGMAEVVKYGVILDPEFFEYLENNADRIMQRDPIALNYIIAQSCRLKAQVVQADERETTGLRAMLNYGHTFAHACEAVFGYGTYLHGEAVSIGMLCASRLAESLGMIDSDSTLRQKRLLESIHLPVDPPSERFDELMKAMQRDKKVEHGKLKFILPRKIGAVESVGDVDPEDVLKAMQV